MCCVAQSGLTRNPCTSAPRVLELMCFAAGDWVPLFGTAQTFLFSSVRYFQVLNTIHCKLVVLMILELGEASSDHPVSG